MVTLKSSGGLWILTGIFGSNWEGSDSDWLRGYILGKGNSLLSVIIEAVPFNYNGKVVHICYKLIVYQDQSCFMQ